MQIYKLVLLCWRVIRANRTPRIVFLLMAAAFAISQPWYASEPYEIIYSGTSWFYLTSGLITGFLILCWNIYDIFSKQGVIMSIGRRSDLAVDIFLLILLISVVCASIYMFVFCGAAACISGDIPFKILSVVMTLIMQLFYVCFCGICFFTAAAVSGKPGAAFLIVMMFPGADSTFCLIKGSPLLLKYVFPPETLLHVRSVTFITGGAVLAASVLAAFIVFTAVVMRKDF